MEDLLNNNLLNNQNYITSKKELGYVIKEFPYKIGYHEKIYNQYITKITFIKVLFIILIFLFLPFFINNESKYLNSTVVGYFFGFLSLYMIYIFSMYSLGYKKKGYEKIRKKKYVFVKRYINYDSLLKNYIFIKK